MSGGLYSTEKNDFDQTLDLKKIKPYGDTMNDGKTQLSFTLPVPAGDEAIEAAKQLLKKIGFKRLRLSVGMKDPFRMSTVKFERGTEYPFSRGFTFSISPTF